MKVISLKYRMMLLAMLPTLLVSLAISGFAVYQTQNSGQLNNEAVRDQLLTLRKNELHAYTQLAESAITNFYATATLPKDDAQRAAKNIIRKLSYGSSGYFFVNDYKGTTLVHAAKPALEGRNLWDLKSKDDKFLIRDIDQAAKDGTGFTEYMWNKPGIAEPVDKITYVKTLDKWNWILGTGLYIDDIDAVHDKLNNQLEANLNRSILVFLGLSGASLLLAAALFGRLTLKQGDNTDHKLKALSDQVNRAQEHERQAIADEIADGVKEHLIGLKERMPKLLAAKGVAQDVTEMLDLEMSKAVKAMQQISHTLNPQNLEEYGLIYGLDILSKQYNDRGRIPVKFSQQGNSGNRLPADVEWEVYRVIQDVLRFVEQHDSIEEGKINLRCSLSPDALKISLLEDVIGFDSKSNSRSGSDSAALLLETVVSRIERINGEISIYGTEGAGTLLKIRLDWASENTPQLMPALAT